MKKIKSIIMIISAAALSVSFCACADKNETSSENGVVFYDDSNSYVNPNEVDSIAQANAESVTGSMGELTTLKNYEVTFEKFYELSPAVENQPNLYAAVFNVKNNSDSDLEISSIASFRGELDGKEAFSCLNATANLAALKTLTDMTSCDGTIAPGESIRGYVSFPIKSSWDKYDLVFMPDFCSGGYDKIIYPITPDMAVTPEQ